MSSPSEDRIDRCCPLGTGYHDLKVIGVSNNMKMWLGTVLLEKWSTVANLSKRFNLPPSTLYTYKHNVRDGHFMHETDGRPRIWDTTAEKAILEELNTYDKYKMTSDTFLELAYNKAKDTHIRRGNDPVTFRGVHRDTISRLETILNINTGKGETTTDARADACADPRNFITFAAMQHLMVSNTVPHLIMNWDATQVKLGYDNDTPSEVKYVGERKGGLKTLPIHNDRGMSFFIKYYCLMTASGLIGDPVYVIADDSMNVHEVDVYEVGGLGIGTHVGQKGYVIFCKTRVGNTELYKWLNLNYLIPWVKNIRSTFNITNKVCWFQLDGESIQIELYRQKFMQDTMNENNITVGKPFASGTSVNQPCDVGNWFKGIKAKLKNIHDRHIMNNHTMLGRLDELYNEHYYRYPHSKAKMSNDHKKMGIRGLLRLQVAFNEVIKQSIITDSFKLCGIHPLDISKIFDNCTTTISSENRLNIVNKMPRLVNIMKQKGEISDAELTKIFDGEFDKTDKIKDNLVVNRRRSIILTNLEFIKNEDNKRLSKLHEREQKEIKKRTRNENKKNKLVTAKPKKKSKVPDVSVSTAVIDEEVLLQISCESSSNFFTAKSSSSSI